jgi:hypothetical protein
VLRAVLLLKVQHGCVEVTGVCGYISMLWLL